MAQRAPTWFGFALRFREPAFWDLNFLYVQRPAAKTAHLVADAAVGAVAAERAFASRAVDGAVVSWARLYTDGALGQIEDVQTLTVHRDRGHAQAAVLGALAASRAAGHGLTFL